jgi:hypothetical protein
MVPSLAYLALLNLAGASEEPTSSPLAGAGTARFAALGGTLGLPIAVAVELPLFVPFGWCLGASAMGNEPGGCDVLNAVMGVGLMCGAAWQLSGPPLLAWASLREHRSLATRGLVVSRRPGQLAWAAWGASVGAAGVGAFALTQRNPPLESDNLAEEVSLGAFAAAVLLHFGSMGLGAWQHGLVTVAAAAEETPAISVTLVPWLREDCGGLAAGARF